MTQCFTFIANDRTEGPYTARECRERVVEMFPEVSEDWHWEEQLDGSLRAIADVDFSTLAEVVPA